MEAREERMTLKFLQTISFEGLGVEPSSFQFRFRVFLLLLLTLNGSGSGSDPGPG
jgi:hypothetical protein